MKTSFHLSISKGFSDLDRIAQSLSCSAIQIFVKNPRSWKEKHWKTEDLRDFDTLKNKYRIFAHASYVYNLARALEERDHIKASEHEIKLCLEIGIPSIVVHPSSYKNTDTGINNFAKAVNHILNIFEINIIIENT